MHDLPAEQHPFIPLDGHSESDLQALEDEIREEAYRVYQRECAMGHWRPPEDDWAEAVDRVLERHGIRHPVSGEMH